MSIKPRLNNLLNLPLPHFPTRTWMVFINTYTGYINVQEPTTKLSYIKGKYWMHLIFLTCFTNIVFLSKCLLCLCLVQSRNLKLILYVVSDGFLYAFLALIFLKLLYSQPLPGDVVLFIVHLELYNANISL